MNKLFNGAYLFGAFHFLLKKCLTFLCVRFILNVRTEKR
uniref:SPBC3B9.21 protein, SPAC19A8.12 protein n=1 Tax=Siphoviridae sp. ctu9a31 TaxID=2825712 RepID=A0A8S5QAK3_9CAUD|nr:MAG TPA: SPBC3B9.21 protein, SPAC19A8.12 protein [Siphoviridae sp. ctu9a31]DAH26517.1 MAG TPA: SPBC3B9.21 protein, SPAC19A8.12 protein [Caudoviricetes sp.]